MIICKLEEKEYKRLCDDLRHNAHAEPLEAFYTVDMFLNGREYSVRLQPEGGGEMVVLQAYEVERDEYGSNFILITESHRLFELLEALLGTGVARRV